MSVLEKLRKHNGLLVGVVGIALLAFVLTGLFERGSSLFGGSENEVGEIAGKSIDYKLFKDRVDQAAEMQKRNMDKNSLSQNEMDAVVQQIWNQMINEEVMNKEYEKLGIAVSDAELYYFMVEHPHPALVRNLSDPQTGKVVPIFADDKTGEISPAKILQFTKAMNNQQEQQWAELENYIRQIRKAEKYNNLIKKGLYVTNATAKADYIVQHSNLEIKYIEKKYATIADSTVKPTDDELNKYYKAHQQEYKQEASRTIEYVTFPIIASSEDIAETKKEIEAITEEFRSTKLADDSAFVVAQSEHRFFDKSFHVKGSLSPEIDTIMFKSEIGTVVGPYLENGSFVVAKLEAVKTAADSAKVRHILIAYAGSGAAEEVSRTQEQAKKEADSLCAVLKKERSRFLEFVDKFSDDGGKKMPPNKAEGEYFPGKGGDYGWMNANSGFVESFKNAGLDGKKGDLSVVESQFGYHIIEVLDVKGSQKKVQVATIDKKIEPSNRTLQTIYVHASDFAGKNTTVESFQKAADEQKLNKRIADNIKENDRTIPGIESPRTLIKWIYENNKGKVSEPMEFGDKYIVALLTEVKEKGIAPFEQVKTELITKVIREKKANQFIKEFEAAINGGSTTVEALSTKMSIPVLQTQNINFSSYGLPSSGNEQSIVGYVTAQKAQTTSKPLIGNDGVYVTYVVSKTEATPQKDYTEQQKSLMAELQNRTDYEVYNALKENANIKEHFVKFGL